MQQTIQATPMVEGMNWAVVSGGDTVTLHEFETLREARDYYHAIHLSRGYAGSYEDENGNFYVRISNVSQHEYNGWVTQYIENLHSQIEDCVNIINDEFQEPIGLGLEFYINSLRRYQERLQEIEN